jgi:sugar lactone lactonase YvrE
LVLAGTGFGLAGGSAQAAAATRPLQVCAIQSVGGALYVGGGSAIKRVNPRTGRLTTLLANMPGVCGVTVDQAGNLLAADGAVVKVVARRSGRFYGRRMIAGHRYIIAGQAGKIRDLQHNGNFGPATKALLSDAVDVAIDHSGNVLIADAGQPRYHEEQPLGALVRLVAERDGRFYGQQMIAGNIYTIAGAGNGPQTNGILATGYYLYQTIGPVRIDQAGNLVLTDTFGGYAHVVAVKTGTFYGQHMLAGHIYGVAGNPANIGNFNNGVLAAKATLVGTDEVGVAANAVAIDHAGNLVIADCTRVRVVAVRTGRFYGQRMSAHRIYSIAGPGNNGLSCFSLKHLAGDGGAARKATVDATWVTVDSSGNVVIADARGGFSGSAIRVVAAATGRFYGRNMRAGDIYTIAN